MEIIRRLGEMACTSESKVDGVCPPYSFVEIGPKVPWWAANWAPYGTLGSRNWVWEPAHSPQRLAPGTDEKEQRALEERDKFMFFTLYKLYQMSLVDTSKLVTGAPPVTISK